MSGEVPLSAKALLGNLVGKPSESAATPQLTLEAVRKKQLFERARGMIQAYGDSAEEGGPKATDSVIVGLGKEGKDGRLLLQLREKAADAGEFTLRVEALRGGNRQEAEELGISVSEAGVKWGEKEATDDEVILVEGAMAFLGESGITPPMDLGKKEQMKEDMKLDSRRLFYAWEMRRHGDDPFNDWW